MSARLIMAIISDILEETAIVVIVLWGLPQLDIHIPLWGLILIMLSWVSFSIFTYRMGSRALRREPVSQLSSMVGSKGTAVSALVPKGQIKIGQELWTARAEEGEIKPGTGVIVVNQNGLKLIVREINAG